MTINMTPLENVSGFDALVNLNDVAGTWPMLLVAVVLTYVVYVMTRQIAEAEVSVWFATLVFALVSGTFAAIGLLSWVPFGIASALFVVTGLLAIHQKQDNTT